MDIVSIHVHVEVLPCQAPHPGCAAAAQRPGLKTVVKNGMTKSPRWDISTNRNVFLISVEQIMARKPAQDVVMEAIHRGARER